MSDIKDEIIERIEELQSDFRDEPNKNRNHMASMIMGEIDGLTWVLELLEEQDDE